MATLQNIRSKGPLLIIFIGLALFAFIAGDAWRVIQPHQSQDVGEVNGKSLSIQEYQALVEEYTEVIKFSQNLSALTDEQTNQVKDEVWRSFVNNNLIQAEAEKIGLTVSKEEVQAIIDAGVHPMLQSTPFRNPQTGIFDKDMLKKFLVDYSKMQAQGATSEYAQYYNSLYTYWTFIEKNLKQSRLVEKYQALLANAITSNPVEAKAAFDARVNQMDLLLAAVPYSSVPDSLVKVDMSDIKTLYNKRKEQFRQLAEARDIKYIDVQIVASAEDKAELNKELLEYTEQLQDATDYTSFVRSTASTVPFVDLYYRKEAFPADVVARLDSAAIGEVYGPYYNSADNTLNVFKKVSKVQAPDSIQFRQIQVYKETEAETRTLADSIYTALRGGADFVELAQKYGQNGDSNWLTSAQYEGAQFSADDLKYISTLTSLNVNELINVQIGMGNLIVQVLNKKDTQEKYKIAVVKRTVDFSTETYNKYYNDFSQFVAANQTLEQLNENAEEAGYRLLERSELYSSAHVISGIRGTKDALRWVFNAKPGEVSGLFECGNNDRLLVVGLKSVTKEGYRPVEAVQSELRAEVLKDKKAEKIIADMKAANVASIDQYKAVDSAVSDTVKLVTFAAPAYISVLRSSEPVVGAIASMTPEHKVSLPVKGNAGVFVVEVIGKETLDETFSAETEMESAKDMNERMVSRFLNDLYQNAKVKDQRYLFF